MTTAAAVIARLASAAPSLGNRVEGAAALGALMASGTYPQATPAAYVVPTGFSGGAQANGTGAHRQMLTRSIEVLWIVNYAGSAAGGEPLADIEEIESEIVAALAGFTPVAGQGSLTVTRSGPDQASDGFFFWRTAFSFNDQLRITS